MTSHRLTPPIAAAVLSGLVVLVAFFLPVAGADQPAGPGEVASITTLTPGHLAAVEEYRRHMPSIGMVITDPAAQRRAVEIRQMLQADDGPARLAKLLVEGYRGEAINTDMQATAIALLLDAGYPMRKTNWADKSLEKQLSSDAKKPEEARLAASAGAIFEQILAQPGADARVAGAEFLLQLATEGIGNLHCESGNGGRRAPWLPHDLVARAGPMLDDADPVVRGMAEWTIATSLGNENQRTRARSWPPEKDAPSWFAAWQAIPASDHLELDYIRQAVSLCMHRRAGDLSALAADQMRRAAARAAWSAERLASAEAKAGLDRASAGMREAYEKLRAAGDDVSAARRAYLTFRRAVRDVVLQGPEMDFDEVVFIKRHSAGFHLQPGVHGEHHPTGGDIYVQKGLAPDGPARGLGLQEKIGRGFAQDLDMHWDGEKVVFAWPADNGVQKLFEIGLDGENLKQLTDGPYHDVDPAWLPDDSVTFGSTRAEAGIMCAGGLGGGSSNGDFGTWNSSHTNIYRVKTDGEVIRLSYCKDDDAYPHCLDDGKVVYMRWDYQERDVNEIFSLWAVRPDGTYSDGFYKVHVKKGLTTQALRDARPVEGHNMLVAAGSGHYSWCEGAVILCDLAAGINEPAGLTNLTPLASPYNHGIGSLMRPVPEGGVPYIGGLYAKPYALSDKSFFVSASYDQPQSTNHAAYYIDVWGNRELIRREKLHEASCPMPVRPRKRPPVIPDMTDPEKTYASLYVDNVYNDLPGVEKGQVKYIRIAQMMFWIRRAGEPGAQWHPLSNASECFGYGTGGPVRVVGIVPVNPDGSAYFKAPADIDLYFQALDANYMSLQRMRTHVEFKPGEVRGCIGCHETRSDVVPPKAIGKALATRPADPVPPPWGTNAVINFEKHIQPIFEAKCVKCHGADKPKAGLDLTARRDQYGFMQSYRSVFGLKPTDPTPRVVWGADGGVPRNKRSRQRSVDHPWWNQMFEGVLVRGGTDGLVTEVKQFGAHQCPLTLKLHKDPKHRKLLTDEEMRALACWVDVQVPYFDTYMQKRRGKLTRVKVVPPDPWSHDRQHKILDPEPATAQGDR